jgi:hypothetical protein
MLGRSHRILSRWKSFCCRLLNMHGINDVYLSMALQSFCSTLAAFQFLNLIHNRRNPWTWDQPVSRPLPTYRTTQTQNKHTQTSMPSMGSNPRSQYSSERRQFMPLITRLLWSAASNIWVIYWYTRKLLQNEGTIKAYMSQNMSCKQKTKIKKLTVQGTRVAPLTELCS